MKANKKAHLEATRSFDDYVRHDAGNSFYKALLNLRTGGCDLDVLQALGIRHAGRTPARAREMRRRLLHLAEGLSKLRAKIFEFKESLGKHDPGRIAEALELDTFSLDLEIREGVFRHWSELWTDRRDAVGIALPLLCVYIEQMTGEPHYADIADMLRAFYSAGHSESKQDLSPEAVRKYVVRYRKREPERYRQFEETVEAFRSQPRSDEPGKKLLTMAYVATGALLESPAPAK